MAVEAVDEVGNPTILATFAVIAAILPMAFVRGLMGPYMRPIPVGASAAMLFSLIVAFVVSPWAALRLLRHYATGSGFQHETEGWTTRLYRRIMNPLVENARRRWIFLGGMVVLLLLACSLVAFKLVKVKMLPFDNKSEFQVIVDMPNGTTLEQTTRVAQELGQYLGKQPEVANYQVYAGTSGPYNFNGLVRHYFLRRGANQADIQVNLLNRHERSAQSHDIAKRLRPGLVEIGNRYGARIKVAEVPPGPPVLETLVAEVYGPDYQQQIELAKKIKQIFQTTPGVVDVDWYVEDPQVKYDVKVDLDKAALHGISAADVTRTVQIGLEGATAGLLHSPESREDVPIRVQLARADRSSIDSLTSLRLPSASGGQVSIGELTNVEKTTIDTSLYGKNLRPVVYVLGDVAGEEESPVYAIQKMGKAIDQIKTAEGYHIKQYNVAMPTETDRLAMKWDGEWHITVEVFRDLGLAFAAVLVLIYVLVVGWFRSFIVPLVIMAPIPLTLVGILPAHALDGSVLHRDFDDRLHRRRGNHCEEFDHPGGLHRAAPRAGHEPGACRGRCRRGTLPADAADRSRGGGGRQRNSVRPDFSGTGNFSDGRRGGFDTVVAHGRAGPVLHGGKTQATGAGQHLGSGALSGGTRMTIERGLRLMAGVFVLLSLALGYWVNPYWYLFTAFVGLNLLQSAFTNWCPGMWMLAKLGLKPAGGV